MTSFASFLLQVLVGFVAVGVTTFLWLGPLSSSEGNDGATDPVWQLVTVDGALVASPSPLLTRLWLAVIAAADLILVMLLFLAPLSEDYMCCRMAPVSAATYAAISLVWWLFGWIIVVRPYYMDHVALPPHNCLACWGGRIYMSTLWLCQPARVLWVRFGLVRAVESGFDHRTIDDAILHHPTTLHAIETES